MSVRTDNYCPGTYVIINVKLLSVPTTSIMTKMASASSVLVQVHIPWMELVLVAPSHSQFCPLLSLVFAFVTQPIMHLTLMMVVKHVQVKVLHLSRRTGYFIIIILLYMSVNAVIMQL